MIASLSGQITDLLPNSLVVETGGVGYEVFVSSNQLAQLKVDSDVKLFIYDHTKEDSHDLYGFIDAESRMLFTQLLSVSGVGPKMALSILNSNRTDKLRDAIASGKSEVLQTVSGVGRKTAERIVIELRSKVVGNAMNVTAAAAHDLAVEALQQLGYSHSTAVETVRKLPDNIKSDEERIKMALKQISGK